MDLVDPILSGKYPAKAHAAKVAAHLQSIDSGLAKSTIYLEGQKTVLLEDNDEPQPFRQRRSFFYLSGCSIPDCYLTYHIPTSRLTLFIPPINPSSVIWSGLPVSVSTALAKYDVDDVQTTDVLPGHLSSLSSLADASLLLIPEQVLDLEMNKDLSSFAQTNNQSLHAAITACRVVKDAYEIASVRQANAISTAAHVAVLKSLYAATNERELEAIFIERCMALGAKNQAYHGIFGAGPNAATLHYVHNNQSLSGKQNVLVDAAAEWNCYCADVTRTFPLKRRFTTESKAIYDVVFKMQAAALNMLRAGIRWEDVHLRAHEVAIEGLLNLGILRSEHTKDEILKAGISVAFFPHGLGHYLGLDTHDPGGNPNYGDKDQVYKYLRVRGHLPAGSIVTVEPGIYFCRFIVEPYLKDDEHKRFIDEKVLEEFWDVGGVRIEDDVLVKEDGYENLTTAPKQFDELERIIDGEGF